MVAIALAVLFSIFAMNGVRYVESDGTLHKGFDSARLLNKEKNQWKGELTPEVFEQIVKENQEVKAQYATEYGLPDDIYAQTEQSYLDIMDLINEMSTEEGEYNPYAIESMGLDHAKNLYQTRETNIEKVVQEEGVTPEQQEFLAKIYDKNKTPFYYEAAESWKAAALLAEEYSMVIVLLIGFFAAGVFADEFQYKADAIFYTTKYGKTKAVHSKIQAGLVIATIVYWGCIAVFTVLTFVVMGISGAKTPIQTEWCYGIYNMTYLQYYLIILVSGYIASLLAASITMLISAKLHSASIATCVPFILFCVSPFLGRALPFHTFFNLTPDQLLNVINTIKSVVVYQVGQNVFRQIPFVMVCYSILAILLLPLTYHAFHKYTIKA